MSDGADKPFQPTPSRIAKAKREGNVVRAQEFGANIAFAAAAAATVAVAPSVGGSARAALEMTARGEGATTQVAFVGAWSLVPLVAAAAGGVLASLAQSGGLAFTPISLKLDRLAPAPGLRRMFSPETATHALRAVAAVALVGAASSAAMRDLFAAALQHSSWASVAATAWNGAQHVVGAIAALGVSLAVLEYGVARRSWLRKLRMSFEEYKRELKEQDGDPATRARRKAMHRNLARGSVAKVKDAAFVIVNPTHVAVALAYRPPDVPVPSVLVRAVDEAALRVRELAHKYHVPIVENVALARALYRDSSVGSPIPHDQYVAVAEIVTALMRSGALA